MWRTMWRATFSRGMEASVKCINSFFELLRPASSEEQFKSAR